MCYLLQAIAIEAHAINQRFLPGKTKQAWQRAAMLGKRSDRPHFNKSEAEGCQGLHVAGILVQPRCQPHWIRKAKAHRCHRLFGSCFLAAQQASGIEKIQAFQRHPISELRGQMK